LINSVEEIAARAQLSDEIELRLILEDLKDGNDVLMSQSP